MGGRRGLLLRSGCATVAVQPKPPLTWAFTLQFRLLRNRYGSTATARFRVQFRSSATNPVSDESDTKIIPIIG